MPLVDLIILLRFLIILLVIYCLLTISIITGIFDNITREVFILIIGYTINLYKHTINDEKILLTFYKSDYILSSICTR
jgi:hypothetical protein